jgi:hypothetical protein
MNKSGKGSCCRDDMRTTMKSVLAAKISVTEAANLFNLPKSSLQDRISKIRKASEIQIPPK